jgi:hypothetical protein
MLPLLQLTSCLFGTVVMHAFYLHMAEYHHLFLALTITSILFHVTHLDHFRLIDKVVAHLCFIRIAADTGLALEQNAPWLLVFPLGVIALWFGQGLVHPPEERDRMHLALHALAIVGLHTYLWALYGGARAPPPPLFELLLDHHRANTTTSTTTNHSTP